MLPSARNRARREGAAAFTPGVWAQPEPPYQHPALRAVYLAAGGAPGSPGGWG